VLPPAERLRRVALYAQIAGEAVLPVPAAPQFSPPPDDPLGSACDAIGEIAAVNPLLSMRSVRRRTSLRLRPHQATGLQLQRSFRFAAL
jgi:hypothetical protein